MTTIADKSNPIKPSEPPKAAAQTADATPAASAAPAANVPQDGATAAPRRDGLTPAAGKISSLGLPTAGVAQPQAAGFDPFQPLVPTSTDAFRIDGLPPATITNQPTSGPAPAEAPVGDYSSTFGGASYVKDSGDQTMVGLMKRAVAQFPELASGPLAQAVQSGQCNKEQVKALQGFLQSKGYDVGRTGVDGKYGPNTHAALAALLNGQPPTQQPGNGPRPAETTNPTDQTAPTNAINPNGPPSDPSRYFISQFRGATNTNAKAHNGNCGPTSILMAVKAFGKINPSPSEVAAATTDIRRRGGATMNEIVGHNSGTTIGQLAQAARSFGLHADPKSGATVADVQAALSQGKLVSVLVKPGAYTASGSTGHYVLVTKVENGKVYLNDPAQQGGQRVVSAAQFARAMSLKGGQIVAVGA